MAIHQLTPDDFIKAADVLAGIVEWNVYVTAVLNQDSLGRIYIDNLAQPQSAFVVSLDYAYLAGNPHNDTFNAERDGGAGNDAAGGRSRESR